MKKIITVLLFSVGLFSYGQIAPTVINNAEFIIAGVGFNENAIPSRVLTTTDSKVIIAGSFSLYNGQTCNNIIGLTDVGTIDPDFITGSGFNAKVNDMIFLTDTSILVVGDFTSYNDIPTKYMVVLNLDGTINTSFATGPNSAVYAAFKQNDDRILLSGAFTEYNNNLYNHILRLNTDYTVDSFFSVDLPNTGWNTMGMLSNGNIVVGGRQAPYMAMLNHDGSTYTDFSFDIDFFYNSIPPFINDIYIDASDAIVAAGRFKVVSGTVYTAAKNIIKVDWDGSINTIFDSGGRSYGNHTYNNVESFSVLPYNYKFLASGFFDGGYTDSNDSTRVLYVFDKVSGAMDTSFLYKDSVGYFTYPFAFTSCIYDMQFLANGDLIIVGNFSRGVLRLTMPVLSTDSVLKQDNIINYVDDMGFHLNTNTNTICNINVFDVSGKTLFTKENYNGNNFDFQFNQNGVYVVSFRLDNGKSYTIKTIK